VIRHSEGGRTYGPFRVYTGDSLGGLAVSRAFGDSVYRQPPHEQGWLVTPAPELIVHPIQERDSILLLASDGLWYVCALCANRLRMRSSSPAAAVLSVIRDVFSSLDASKFIMKQFNSDPNGGLDRIAN
jgi:serine/threonine protein phosphatase PrpC